MPNDFISIDQNSAAAKYAGDLVRYKELYRSVLDLGEKIADIMNHNTDGTAYTGVETIFGIPAGNGDDVYNMILGSLGAIKGQVQSADGMTLIGRVG